MERFAGKRAEVRVTTWIVFDPMAPKDTSNALGPIRTSDVLIYPFKQNYYSERSEGGFASPRVHGVAERKNIEVRGLSRATA